MPQRNRSKRIRNVALMAASSMLLLTGCDTSKTNYMVLNPTGPVAKQELDLIILLTVLTMLVIIPVLLLLWYIVWRYRDKPGNTAKYSPNWAHHPKLELIWWGIPVVIVGILGFRTAQVIHNLAKPIPTEAKPITIQVTSLDWKWLFQYPGQKVATVNYLEVPTGVPVQFQLTSDGPINGLWIPQLGGQEYTMPGMTERMWLQADKPGTYYGHSGNFSGAGFADMSFTVKAVSQQEFDAWVQQIKSTSPALTEATYNTLKQPGVVGTSSYSSFPDDLYNNVVWSEGGRYMSSMMPSMNMQGGN